MWWIHSSMVFIALHSFLCINVGCTPLATWHPIPMQHWEEVETEVRMWGKLPLNQPTTIRSCHLASFHSSPPTNGCIQQPPSDLVISDHFKLCNSSDFFLDAFPIPIRLHSQADAKQLKCSFMTRVLTIRSCHVLRSAQCSPIWPLPGSGLLTTVRIAHYSSDPRSRLTLPRA